MVRYRYFCTQKYLYLTTYFPETAANTEGDSVARQHSQEVTSRVTSHLHSPTARPPILFCWRKKPTSWLCVPLSSLKQSKQADRQSERTCASRADCGGGCCHSRHAGGGSTMEEESRGHSAGHLDAHAAAPHVPGGRENPGIWSVQPSTV